jgi:hypothetical protein
MSSSLSQRLADGILLHSILEDVPDWSVPAKTRPSTGECSQRDPSPRAQLRLNSDRFVAVA